MHEIINPYSHVPRYIQIANWIKEMINRGRFPVSQKLPSEKKLADMCGVNRNTVRQALDDLINRGCISKRVGIGTFVENGFSKSVNYSLDNITSFAEDMRSSGYKPSTRLISQKVLEGPKEIAEKLGLSPGAKIVQTTRVRRGNGTQLILEKSHLPYDEFKQILNMKLTGSFYRLLTEEFGIQLERSYQTFSAIDLPHAVAKLLEVPPRSAGMFLESIVFDVNSVAIEVLHAFFRGDRYTFHVHSGKYKLGFRKTSQGNY